MIIRKAKTEDYESIIPFLNGFVEEDRYSGKNKDSFLSALKKPENHIYVAEEDGKLIGFVTFSIRTVIRYVKPIAELDELYIAPSARKQGLGSKLVQTVIDAAAEKGCHRLFIESHYKHEAAHKLYEKMGFTNYGYHFIKNL